MLRFSLAVVLLAPVLAFAAEGDLVFPGDKPSEKKAVQTSEGRAILFGPLEITPELAKTTGEVYLSLENVTFDKNIGSDSGIYIVDGAAKGKQLKIDQRNYVGSAANVIGGEPKPVDILLTIHDYKVGKVDHKPRTKFKAMKSVYLAIVVRAGDVKFERAIISAKSPADTGVGK